MRLSFLSGCNTVTTHAKLWFFVVRFVVTVGEEAGPEGNEVLENIAASGSGVADALGARPDAEGHKQMGQPVGIDESFLVPGAVGFRVQPLPQNRSRDAFGVAVMGKDPTQDTE